MRARALIGMTLGALRELRRRGDTTTALLGFDDFDGADVLGTSVVSYDAVEVGRSAGRLVRERLENPGGPLRRIVLPTWVIERGSGERRPAAVV